MRRALAGIVETWQEDELTPGTSERIFEREDRSLYIPRDFRDAVALRVKQLGEIHLGPHNHRMKGAYVTRNYSEMAAGDWFQGDDLTGNHYFHVRRNGSWEITRGQLLVFIDTRTNFVLGFNLIDAKVYNARGIRESILRIHDEWGLPRKGFYFEKGIWKSAKILTGDKANTISMEETEQGLREFGVRFQHATNPRAKQVERVLGILQTRCQHLPGYVGRNEQTEKHERLQKALGHARRHPEELPGLTLSREQYSEQLSAIIADYNSTPQPFGKLGSLSPKEAYEQLFNFEDPLVKLSGAGRYLLANHRKVLQVGRNGIALKFGRPGEAKETWFFRSRETGELRGQKVKVWYATDEAVPESVTITDLNNENPVEVPREIRPAAMDATAEEVSAARSQAEAHNAPARELYSVVSNNFASKGRMFRRMLADNKTTALGERIGKSREEIRSERAEQTNLTRQANKLQRETGTRVAPNHRDARQKVAGLSLTQVIDKVERNETLTRAEETLLRENDFADLIPAAAPSQGTGVSFYGKDRHP